MCTAGHYKNMNIGLTAGDLGQIAEGAAQNTSDLLIGRQRQQNASATGQGGGSNNTQRRKILMGKSGEASTSLAGRAA
jgi:hypothetical protein